MASISTFEARQNLGKLLELAFYRGERFRVERNKKTLAWIVGDPQMSAISRFIDHIMKYEPALADTLALMLDEELNDAIAVGTKEISEGKTIPLEKALDD